jgi:hypothetical protein
VPNELLNDLACALDPVLFFRRCLGFDPDPLQTALVRQAGPRVLLNCCRQWGKSTLAAALALHRAWHRPGSLVLVVSPAARQSREFLRKARALSPPARTDGDNAISLAFPNGSRLVGLPGREATVRGFSAVSLMLIDEAARVSDELYRAVRPMLAVGQGDLWMMSTPFGRRGFFYEEWAEGSNEWVRFSVPATACPRIPAAFLDEERRALGDRWFRQEYLCEFLETRDSLFPYDLVSSALSPGVLPLFPDR